MTHILLVEDNPIDARLIHRMFKEAKDWPTQVTWLADGRDAMSYVASLDQGRIACPPSLILLDLNLPRYDGLQILSALRDSHAASSIPVFLISSAPADTLELEARGCGLAADGYLQKPYGLAGFESMGTLLREFLESRLPAPVVRPRAMEAAHRAA